MKKSNPKPTKRKNKIYTPKKQLNPTELNKRIELLNGKIEKNNSIIDMREQALNNYIRLMTNFASHDIKNAVHNLDGYINTLVPCSITENDIRNLTSILDGIRKTIKDFTCLAPDQTKGEFVLFDLCNSIELLNRGQLNDNNVEYEINYIKEDETVIQQSLHNLIQTANNLIINSIKALEKQKEKRIIIDVYIENEFLTILVKDNGCGIKKSNKDKIFDLHFSTTGGSGIGLAHAKYIIDNIADAELSLLDTSETTTFQLLIPIK